MQMFIQSSKQLTKKIVLSNKKWNNISISKISKNFSTLGNFQEKERGDETRFIRSQEALRQAELKARVDHLLSLDDANENKATLVELLSKLYNICCFIKYINCTNTNIIILIIK